MTSKEKILYAKHNFAELYKCESDIWDYNENVFIEYIQIYTNGRNFGYR